MILIADRNRHVRQFLKREFVADGYLVVLAENGHDLSRIIGREDTLDLLILDDEILGLDESRIVEQLGNRIPPLPFIIHSFSTEGLDRSLVAAAAALVEKTGKIEQLKEAVKQVLRREYPCRFDPADRRPLDRDARNSRDPACTMGTRKE